MSYYFSKIKIRYGDAAKKQCTLESRGLLLSGGFATHWLEVRVACWEFCGCHTRCGAGATDLGHLCHLPFSPLLVWAFRGYGRQEYSSPVKGHLTSKPPLLEPPWLSTFLWIDFSLLPRPQPCGRVVGSCLLGTAEVPSGLLTPINVAHFPLFLSTILCECRNHSNHLKPETHRGCWNYIDFHKVKWKEIKK